MKTFRIVVIVLLFCTVAISGSAMGQAAQATRGHTRMLMTDEVRHQLMMIPNYGIFDWLEAEAKPDNSMVLRGYVTNPSTKTDAEYRLKKLESVGKVVNEIEVLPVSPSDDAIRIATYRAIFRYDSPLFRYALMSQPPIHIIVNNGRVTLKGIVGSKMDQQLVYTAARQVPGVFDVKDELVLEKEG